MNFLDRHRSAALTLLALVLIAALLGLILHFAQVSQNNVNEIRAVSQVSCLRSDLTRLQTDSFEGVAFQALSGELQAAPGNSRHIRTQISQLIVLPPTNCRLLAIEGTEYRTPPPVRVGRPDGSLNPAAAKYIREANEILPSPRPLTAVAARFGLHE